MTKSKTKTKVTLMEPTNSLKTIISTVDGSLSQNFCNLHLDIYNYPYLFLFASRKITKSLKLNYTKTLKTYKNYTNSFLPSLTNKLMEFAVQWFQYVAIPESYINTM